MVFLGLQDNHVFSIQDAAGAAGLGSARLTQSSVDEFYQAPQDREEGKSEEHATDCSGLWFKVKMMSRSFQIF